MVVTGFVILIDRAHLLTHRFFFYKTKISSLKKFKNPIFSFCSKSSKNMFSSFSEPRTTIWDHIPVSAESWVRKWVRSLIIMSFPRELLLLFPQPRQLLQLLFCRKPSSWILYKSCLYKSLQSENDVVTRHDPNEQSNYAIFCVSQSWRSGSNTVTIVTRKLWTSDRSIY